MNDVNHTAALERAAVDLSSERNCFSYDPGEARIHFHLLHFWAAPQLHLCNYLWDNSVHQQHKDLVCTLASLSILNFVTFQVRTHWILNTCLVILCIMELGQDIFQVYSEIFLPETLCSVCVVDNMTNQMEWNIIVLWWAEHWEPLTLCC